MHLLLYIQDHADLKFEISAGELQRTVHKQVGNFKDLFFCFLIPPTSGIIFSPSPPPLYPSLSRFTLLLNGRGTGFSTVQERLYQRRMKAD